MIIPGTVVTPTRRVSRSIRILKTTIYGARSCLQLFYGKWLSFAFKILTAPAQHFHPFIYSAWFQR